MREPVGVSTLTREQQRSIDHAVSRHAVRRRVGQDTSERAQHTAVASVFGIGRELRRAADRIERRHVAKGHHLETSGDGLLYEPLLLPLPGDGGRVGAAGRTAEPLDKLQSYQTPVALPPLIKATDQAVSDARQEERYRRLGWLRYHSSRKRLRMCKAPIGNGRVGMVAHDGGAHFTGVTSCGNVWCCPVCAPKIRALRTTDVLQAFELHEKAGGGLVWLTLTLPHNIGDRLAELLKLLSEAWIYVSNSRNYKGWKKRSGMLGNIASLEVTDGDNGWHPHRHLMLFTERPLSKDAVAAWAAEMQAVYDRYLVAQGWTASKDDVGVHMEYVADVSKSGKQLGKYMTKLQAGFELTRSDLKMSRSAKGMMPMDLVEEAIMGDERAKQRWHEYEQAMAGKSAVRFSRGLRAKLGMEVKEKTDQELAEQEVGGDAGLYLAAPLYRRLFKDGLAATTLRVYRSGGDVAVLAFVEAKYPGQYIADETEYDGLVLFLRPRGKPV